MPAVLDALLHAALQCAPRRYRLPPLPADARAARADSPAAAVAVALEAVRRSQAHGDPLPRDAREAFLAGMASLIRTAMGSPHGAGPGPTGDPGYQALVLRRDDAEVDEYASLVARRPHDERIVRAAVDAVAHPGKLQRRATDRLAPALEPLHRLASAGEWAALRHAIEHALADAARGDAGTEVSASLRPLLDDGSALARLERLDVLHRRPGVAHYRRLHARAGPASGSAEAGASGQASGERGDRAEAEVVRAFDRLAHRLSQCATDDPRPCRVARSLRTPAALASARRAKAEWDAALVADEGGGAGNAVLLLAEVKSSPAAATTDWPRLRAGLAGLAQASADQTYAFPSPDGAVHIRGASLRGLQPGPLGVPDHVVYCCLGPPEPRPPMLSAASRAMLLSEPASVAHAQALAHGSEPPPASLAALWRSVCEAPHLHAVRWQHADARAAREAMLHPADLLDALELVAARAHPH